MSSADHADIIFDKMEDSEETTSISDAAGASTPSYDQDIDAPTKVTEDIRTPNSTTAETAPEPRIEWSTEDTDIGEPPVYMLAGIEVDDDDGWQVSGECFLFSYYPHAHPRPQPTAATVVFKTVTALGLTLARDTKHPLG